MQGRQIGLLRRDGETQGQHIGPAPVLQHPLAQTFLLRVPEGSPDSLVIRQPLLEPDKGHVIVIKFMNAFCFFPIDVVVGVKKDLLYLQFLLLPS